MINGINTRHWHADRYRQHGFMLFVTCVLSLAAVIFAVDFAALSDESSRNIPRNNTAQQVEDTSAIPPRQQSASLSQTIRAILVEAASTKIKVAYPGGNSNGLLARSADMAFYDSGPVETAAILRPLKITASYHASARAPPPAI
ncbi:hypothetical protein KUG47_10165 [Falsochrobactrum sp. TDYN1]|uniref:Uncharacterized protein n=1 Tax=Falsochrobactrum tianjinense TaxID=2706015 RepID=A0A949PPJ0_9HYPH|nr:hypothetical protein [Falsochrobactrum sp. TDYN1]MBV2143859.1 hypothetical protein [Falsochrobactrum sp. TDYN1]